MIVLISAKAGTDARQATAVRTAEIFFDIIMTSGLERLQGETHEPRRRGGTEWGISSYRELRDSWLIKLLPCTAATTATFGEQSILSCSAVTLIGLMNNPVAIRRNNYDRDRLIFTYIIEKDSTKLIINLGKFIVSTINRNSIVRLALAG